LTTLVLLGGLLLGAMSCGDSDTSAPSAAEPPTTSAAATTEPPVTTRIADFRIDQGNISTDDDGGRHSRDGTIDYRVVSDDPRVTGTVSGTWNSDRWGTGMWVAGSEVGSPDYEWAGVIYPGDPPPVSEFTAAIRRRTLPRRRLRSGERVHGSE
jgi:hypothetical protein